MVTRPFAGLVALVSALVSGCLEPARYPCDDDRQCRSGAGDGVCTDAGWCAYSDGACASELRYSELAAVELAGACVPAEGEGTTDASSTGAVAHCPPGCSAVPHGRCRCGDTGEATSAGSSTGAPDCDSVCIAGAHVASATCDETGTCVLVCQPPWQDCDGEIANGCEVPVGVAHQCSVSGLDPVQGCWTAYCGSSESTSAVNFGSYYCIDCITCEYPTGTSCRWCNHATGQWYPAEPDCACGDSLGAVCAP